MHTLCEPISINASSSTLGRLTANVMQRLHCRKLRKIDRDAFQQLTTLDDSLLNDIGVSRADVEWAMKLPRSQDASVALQLVSRGYVKRT